MGGVDVLIDDAAYDYRADIGALDLARIKDMFETTSSDWSTSPTASFPR